MREKNADNNHQANEFRFHGGDGHAVCQLLLCCGSEDDSAAANVPETRTIILDNIIYKHGVAYGTAGKVTGT